MPSPLRAPFAGESQRVSESALEVPRPELQSLRLPSMKARDGPTGPSASCFSLGRGLLCASATGQVPAGCTFGHGREILPDLTAEVHLELREGRLGRRTGSERDPGARSTTVHALRIGEARGVAVVFLNFPESLAISRLDSVQGLMCTNSKWMRSSVQSFWPMSCAW